MDHQTAPKYVPPTVPRKAKREKALTHWKAHEATQEGRKSHMIARPKLDPGTGAISTRMHSPEDRHRMIAEAAYHKAEQRQFVTGYELEDWLSAEHEIDAILFGETAAKEIGW